MVIKWTKPGKYKRSAVVLLCKLFRAEQLAHVHLLPFYKYSIGFSEIGEEEIAGVSGHCGSGFSDGTAFGLELSNKKIVKGSKIFRFFEKFFGINVVVFDETQNFSTAFGPLLEHSKPGGAKVEPGDDRSEDIAYSQEFPIEDSQEPSPVNFLYSFFLCFSVDIL